MTLHRTAGLARDLDHLDYASRPDSCGTMALSSGAVRSRSENSMFVLMVILLGSPAVWCFVGRLEGATIIGTDQWRNG